MNALERTVIGTVQKARDFADYAWNRTRLLLRFRWDQLRHRRLLGSRCRRILIVRLGSIGDVIRATAIVEALRRRHPNAQIDLLTSDMTVSLIQGLPGVKTVFGLTAMAQLPEYDWVVNLQTPNPTAAFLLPGVSYRDVLDHISTRCGATIVSGRQIRNGQEFFPTNILYCQSEMEELFLIALLDFDASRYPRTDVPLDPAACAAVQSRFPLPEGPRLALFLGSNSVGCGADEGFRTYSMDFLERVIEHFSSRFTVVVIGQSSVRTADEQARYQSILGAHGSVVDLVDKTTLPELACVIDRCDVLVACDSSPIHLALARRTPAVALYVLEGSFRLGPQMEYEGVIALNSASPCFNYTWRWKYFCRSCRNPQTRAAYCTESTFAFGVDRIPLQRIDDAVTRLLPSNRVHQASIHDQSR